MALLNPELAIELLQQDLNNVDLVFPDDDRLCDVERATAWLLRTYHLFRPFILQENFHDYSLILSRLARPDVMQETMEQTRLDLYAAVGQVKRIYKMFDQRERS